jgi:hypothetical protein
MTNLFAGNVITNTSFASRDHTFSMLDTCP